MSQILTVIQTVTYSTKTDQVTQLRANVWVFRGKSAGIRMLRVCKAWFVLISDILLILGQNGWNPKKLVDLFKITSWE